LDSAAAAQDRSFRRLEKPNQSNSDWVRSFEDAPREHGFEPVHVEGKIPDDLVGTLYWNGSAFYDLTPPELRTWTDGQGGIGAVHIPGGGAAPSFGLRRIRTRSMELEHAAGKRIYSRFGMRSKQPIREFLLGDRRTTANITCWCYRGRIFALDTISKLTEVDPNSLETLGETDLNGSAPPALSAHGGLCAARRTYYNFSPAYGRQSYLDLYAFPLESRPYRVTRIPLAAACYVHSFIVTDNYAIFIIPPMTLRPLPMVLGLKAAKDCIVWRPELGTECVVVNFDAPERPIRCTIDARLHVHVANAFERKGEVVVHVPFSNESHDGVLKTWQWFTGLASGKPGLGPDPRMHELRIDVQTGRARVERLADRVFEQPRISPRSEGRDYRYIFGAGFIGSGAQLPDALLTFDLKTNTISETRHKGCYLAEPVFVPREHSTAENDGYLLSVAYEPEAHTSSLLVFDAREAQSAPLCRLAFDHHVPPFFHASWVGRGDEVTGSVAPGRRVG